MDDPAMVERFRRGRRDPALAVLEGFHALKHALRFGAEVLEAVATDAEAVSGLAHRLAPDLAARLPGDLRTIPPETLDRLTPTPPATGVMAIARRPVVHPGRILADPRSAPVVLLEAPRRPENVGAAVRTAAAAGAAGVLVLGGLDPWTPAAIRGSSGLHYAVPVAGVKAVPASDRPIVALHPEGRPLSAGTVPDRAILTFGSERTGLGEEILRRADARLAIPMRLGVSSLNLGAAVAVVLYAWRLRPGGG